MKNRMFPAILFLIISALPLCGFETYYKDTKKEYISKGVTYEETTMITDMGLLDIYTLRIPANDPGIILSAAISQDEIGLKETATKLLSDTAAAAGVNGDFFGVAGAYSMPMGLTVDTNGVLSVSNNANTGKNRYSSFMLADDGNYFMDYINVSVRFFNNGEENIQLGSINKVADLAGPTVITPDMASTTAEIDARIDGAVKVLVRGDYITYISGKGETVEIPYDGYAVVMSAAAADECIWRFAPGQRAELVISANIDIWSLKSAISGGGRILLNGELVTEGSYYISGVQPRTAIGINKEMTEIILIVADGRGQSVGLTHEQLAQILLDSGAYNAMHLDGGGSSEMSVRKIGEGDVSLVSNPSGGFQRKVINAFGVYVQAPEGEISSIAIEPYADTVITASALKMDIYGLDEYMRRIEIPQNLVTVTATGVSNYFDGYFTAYENGDYTVTASFGGFSASCTVTATPLYQLIPSIAEIKTKIGGQTVLSYKGIGKDGNLFDVDPFTVGVEVRAPGLGSVRDAVFTAEGVGTGWLRCYANGVNAYIPVNVTILELSIDSLQGNKPLFFSAYPETVYGAAYYAMLPGNQQPSASLYYHFDAASYTQAAYADLQGLTGIEAKGLTLSVYGDLSGVWLRGRITDANGVQHLIDFARVIDWEGWKETEAWFPEDVAYPVTLDRIYVASVNCEKEITSQIFFCNLRGLYDFTWQYPAPEPPKGDVFKDSLEVVFYDWTEYGYDITFMPGVSVPFEGEAAKNKALDVFLYNASACVYMTENEPGLYDNHQWAINQNNPGLVEYRPEFSVLGAGNLFIIQMTARGGYGNDGFMFADKGQWARIKSAILASYTGNIVILTDVSPLVFSNKKESSLFHSMLAEFAQAGKNIFVISTGSGAPSTTVMDSVRYITLGELYEGGDLNPDFSVLRFRIKDDDIKYSIERIFQ